MARGSLQSRSEGLAVLALRGDPRADAVVPGRVHPALRERVCRLRDGVQPQPGPADRADPHRRVLHRQRARQPAPRAGARIRHVRGARADDAHLHPASAPLGEVGEVRKLRMAPSAYVWLLLGAAYFIIPLYATLDFSLKKNVVGTPCCTLKNYGWVVHNGDFWHTIKISFLLSRET